MKDEKRALLTTTSSLHYKKNHTRRNRQDILDLYNNDFSDVITD